MIALNCLSHSDHCERVCGGEMTDLLSGSSVSMAGPQMDEEKSSLATCNIPVAS